MIIFLFFRCITDKTLYVPRKIIKLIAEIYNKGFNKVIIILIDGESIIGDLPFRNYLSNINGGINSLGGGFVFSLSAGWSKSLWKCFREKVARTMSSISNVYTKTEARIEGFVTFIKLWNNNQPFNIFSDDYQIQMEGVNWFVAVITKKRVDSNYMLNKIKWIPAFFRSDSFMFPKTLWEKIAQFVSMEKLPI